MAHSSVCGIRVIKVCKHFGELSEHFPDLILFTAKLSLKTFVFSVCSVQLIPERMLNAVMIPSNFSELIIHGELDFS